jgi:alpha-glucosidase
VGEAASADTRIGNSYLSSKGSGCDTVITFAQFKEKDLPNPHHLPPIFLPKSLHWREFKRALSAWQAAFASLPVLYWNNHDKPRSTTRFCTSDQQLLPQNAKALAALMYLQRGILSIYYGEEIATQNYQFAEVNDFADQQAHDFYDTALGKGLKHSQAMDLLNQTHRLAARGPFNWAEAKLQQADAASVLNYYKALIALKKTPLFSRGDCTILPTEQEDLFVYKRTWEQQTALVLVNLSPNTVTLTTQSVGLAAQPSPQVLLQSSATITQGTASAITLNPFGVLVLQAPAHP